MKYTLFTAKIVIVMMIMNGCAGVQTVPLPESLAALRPDSNCPHESRAGGWDIKAQLLKTPEATYLAMYFDPHYILEHEPEVNLLAGSAVYEGQNEKIYYYRLGTLPKGNFIGTISFRTPMRSRFPGGHLADQIVTLRMERRSSSDCLKLIER